MLVMMTAGSCLMIIVDAATSVQCGIGLGENITGTVFICATGQEVQIGAASASWGTSDQWQTSHQGRTTCTAVQ